MEFKKVNITLPVPLFEKCKELVNKGLYSNFSDLVRSSLRKEIKEYQNILNAANKFNDRTKKH